MYPPSVVTIILILSSFKSATSVHNDTLCLSGSTIPPYLDKKYTFTYQYKDTQSNGSIYFNAQLNFYLFPWEYNESDFKRYLIGSNPSAHEATSFNNIRTTYPYSFNPEDFIKNWQSWNGTFIDDINMRLVNCDSLCIHDTQYTWIDYAVSTETSVYYSQSTNLYLHRRNINTDNERYHITNSTHMYFVDINDIHIGNCDSHTNMDIDTTFAPILTEFANPTNSSTNPTNSSTNDIEPVYGMVTKEKENSLALIIILVSVALIFLVIGIVFILKKCVFHKRRQSDAHSRDSTRPNQSERHLSVRSSVDFVVNKKSMSTSNQFEFSSDDMSLRNNRKLSTKSNSKYADILPVSKPPPIGMQPVLTAKQQSERPLPPTPTFPPMLL